MLIAPLDGVGRDYPLSIEKLCPVLSYYVVKDWREGCERCKQILRYGGMGHTMSIHSQNDQVILEFGLHKPAFRIVVNSPTTHGSIGLTTGLDPAMTLGCGGYGGNITSDNISPRHLLNIKRVAYELTPAVSRWDRAARRPADGGPAPGLPSVAGHGRRRRPGSAPRRCRGGSTSSSARAASSRSRSESDQGQTRVRPELRSPGSAGSDPGQTRSDAARFRLRGGRPAGDPGRAEAGRFRAGDRDAGGARSRRAAPGLHGRTVARIAAERLMSARYRRTNAVAQLHSTAEPVGLIVDQPIGSFARLTRP